MKAPFANKMHPCEICIEADQTLDVHQDIDKKFQTTKDPKLKRAFKPLLDQWAKKVDLLKLHKKHPKSENSATCGAWNLHRL